MRHALPPRVAASVGACVLAAAAGGAGSAGCAPAEPAPLRVFAAASLTEIVGGLAETYPGARVAPSFGASSALARQIRDGAPADVFLSASPGWIEFLREAGAIAGEPIAFARGRLICIAAREGRLAAGRSPAHPRALLEALGAHGRVAIADEGVPAGDYARDALAHLGLLRAFLPHLVGQRDARAVLHAVERGELAVGFVYATDARGAAVETLFSFDATTHPPVAYWAAALRGARDPAEARRFVDALRGEAARARLAGAGFAPP